MAQEMINQKMLPENACFGCGHHNPQGLKVEIHRDEKDDQRLVGIFNPPEHMIGFPGITHGGAIYTALDCMAAWVPMALRREIKAIWILRSAAMTYHRPAHQGRPLELSAGIEEENGPGRPMVVWAKAKDKEGNLLSEGTFKVVPLSPEKFKKVAEIEEIPQNYANTLLDGA